MKSASAKAKGRRAEAKFAALLRQKDLDKKAVRMPLSGAHSHFKTDIYTTIPFSVEVKNQETVKLWQWWDQTIAQTSPPKRPLLVVGANHRPQLAVMRAEDWADMQKEIVDLTEQLTELRDGPGD